MRSLLAVACLLLGSTAYGQYTCRGGQCAGSPTVYQQLSIAPPPVQIQTYTLVPVPVTVWVQPRRWVFGQRFSNCLNRSVANRKLRYGTIVLVPTEAPVQ